MTDLAYPWRWLADGVGTAFVLRYPWIDAVRRAAGHAEAACVLVPEVAGPLADWGQWLAERIDEEVPTPRLLIADDFPGAARELCDAYAPERRPSAEPDAGWSRRFLGECRREIPHVQTVPLLVIGADDDSCSSLRDMVRAQRELGYPFVRPILLRRALPLEWDGEVIRFGIPEWVGDLNRITPPPARDTDFWTNLLLALTVAWEAGAVPPLAEELWDLLRLRRNVSLRDGAFDTWLRHELNGFATRNRAAFDGPIPDALAFGPIRFLKEDGPWQRGAVAWEGDAFDVTPLKARLWAADLEDDAGASLHRRRLSNVPLARWLSAWAASIEESMRVAALQAGSERFRRFLDSQPPRSKGHSFRSRLEELGVGSAGDCVGLAKFGDLTAFLSKNPPRPTLSNLPRMLDLCHQARNRVVHQRLVSTTGLWPSRRG
jgi:hypothetical protein